MPWTETCVMDERMCFVAACLEGVENMSALCLEFGISRRTGYKWLARYRAEGVVGLADRSRAPHTNPRALAAAVAEAVVAVRRRHPTWGADKVKAYLERTAPDRVWPSASSIGRRLAWAGLVKPRKRRVRTPGLGRPFAACLAANDVWCVDFKGWFLTGDGIQVDPLTLSDGHSRYLLCCEAVGRCDEGHVWPHIAAAFREYGLPKAMRSDNGPPFASRGAAGLSRLAVKLIKAGVLPERIEPGKPQQNGRHERMHLTLKQDTASPPAASLAEQIVRFREFQRIYNHERPHQALGQVPPVEFYEPSPRSWDGKLHSPGYDSESEVRKVRQNGEIKWKGRAVFVAGALKGEPVGLTRIGERTWLVKYGPIILGTIKGENKMHRIAPNNRRKKQKQTNKTKKPLPMS